MASAFPLMIALSPRVEFSGAASFEPTLLEGSNDKLSITSPLESNNTKNVCVAAYAANPQYPSTGLERWAMVNVSSDGSCRIIRCTVACFARGIGFGFAPLRALNSRTAGCGR